MKLPSPITIIWRRPVCQARPIRRASSTLKMLNVAPESTYAQTLRPSIKIGERIESVTSHLEKYPPEGGKHWGLSLLFPQVL
jgi:hypothetical protein